MKARKPITALLCLACGAWLSAAESAPAPTGAPVVPPAAPAPKETGAAKAFAAAKAPGVAVPLSPRFQQVRDRIQALFSGRLETPPPPDPRYNPFRPTGAAPLAPIRGVAAGGETPSPASAGSDQVVLQQAVATLKVRGTIERGGRSQQLQVAINAGPNRDGTYKEGDVITVIVQEQPYHLRVRQITRYSVMFSLNDAEYTLKF